MIIRKDSNDQLLVIGQTDHSRLVGQLAAHWGNADFAAPRPFESVVRAATFHDYGWLRYETSPLIDPDSGEPYQFLKVPLTATQLAGYQWSLDWMAEIDPYAGLIVSMHRTGLWRGRYQTIKHPSGYNIKTMSPDIEAFLVRNETWQQGQRAQRNHDEVWTNYRLMQVWDLLGLYFCCQDPYEHYTEPVPTGYGSGDDSGTRLTMKPAGPRTVAFDPYPFDVRPCRVQLTYKRLPAATFPSLEAFRRAYFQAGTQLMEFELT
jgi:Protein of unknown function (DUF3891)